MGCRTVTRAVDRRLLRDRRRIRRIGAAAAVLALVSGTVGIGTVLGPSYSAGGATPWPSTTSAHADGDRPINRTTTKTKESPDADTSVVPTPAATTTPADRDPAGDTAGPTATSTRGPGRTTGPVDGEPSGGADVEPGTPTAGPGDGGVPDAGGEGPPASTGDDVLDLVNAHRAEAGCGALTLDGALDANSQAWSDAQAAADTMSHSPGAGTTYGENVAVGYPTAADVVAAWMASPGHRDNILNCEYSTTGTGVTADDTGPYWTQQFGF